MGKTKRIFEDVRQTYPGNPVFAIIDKMQKYYNVDAQHVQGAQTTMQDAKKLVEQSKHNSNG